ncbi:unnamed protein product [Cuscuta campestris]|uniref:Uncharacterized protein n=1 Tax=Cuscuta campestris TaxID=132261 RepID=A0A484MEE3_9ASTE|nr:unnamed protein product [Cuscuta campestris]VFQ86462.1 unnamed protein product [Cuscuta campestris]
MVKQGLLSHLDSISLADEHRTESSIFLPWFFVAAASYCNVFYFNRLKFQLVHRQQPILDFILYGGRMI